MDNSIIEIHDSLYDYNQVFKTENLASTKDLCGIFYTKEGGFEFYPPDRTEKGEASVSKPTLDILLSQIKQEINSRG